MIGSVALETAVPHPQPVFATLLLLATLSACTNEVDEVEPTPTWHEDVRPIIEETCVSCHNDEGGLTGVPLTTYEDAQAWRDPIAAAVSTGTMPPWRAESDCNDYKDDFSLSDEEVDILVRWAEGGTPEGDPAKAAPTRSPWVPPTLERVDATLVMSEAYTPDLAPDDYRCFIVDWDEPETTWLTGYHFSPGNANIVHHVIPFIIPPGDASVYRDLDSEASGNGYPCFGGPGGNIDSLIEARWLGAWAPGSGAYRLPDGYGLEIDPGSLMVLQVHYHTETDNTETDLSSVEVQLEHTPQKGAEIQPWTEINWVLGLGMDIPAGTSNVSHTFSTGIQGSFQIHNSTLHMHTLGKSAAFTVKHADGSESCMLRHDEYDFNWQRGYDLAEPADVKPGDTVELTCTWDNPTDQDVSWGDGTGDEMCLAISLITWE